MKDTTIAVDLAKSVFQVAVSHRPGRVDAERRLARERFLEYLAKQPPATVLLEACGLLREFGIVIPVGAQHVVPQVRELLALSPHVPDLMRTSLSQACDEIQALATQMRAVERQLIVLARNRDDLQLLQTIPGIGVLTATALVALVGDIHRFQSSRQFASFLGLTPKEDSSGCRRRLGAIGKQGDIYLRIGGALRAAFTLARAVVCAQLRHEGQVLRGAQERRPEKNLSTTSRPFLFS